MATSDNAFVTIASFHRPGDRVERSLLARLAVAVIALLVSAPAAHAEVGQSENDSFFVKITRPVAATQAKTYTAITQVQRWWDDAYTWSGKASNLTLAPEAGGCLCERWKDGSAEHGRVVMALPGRLLRLDIVPGPLQEFALKGILTFWIAPDVDSGSRSELEVEYRVNGASGSGLDALAPQVDAMLSDQLARLVRYIETGHADAPIAAKKDETAGDAQATILQAWAKSAAETLKVDKKNSARAPKSHPAPTQHPNPPGAR